MESLFIVEVIDDGEKFEYEYGSYEHANEQYNMEVSATMYEYKNTEHYFVKAK